MIYKYLATVRCLLPAGRMLASSHPCIWCRWIYNIYFEDREEGGGGAHLLPYFFASDVTGRRAYMWGNPNW